MVILKHLMEIVKLLMKSDLKNLIRLLIVFFTFQLVLLNVVITLHEGATQPDCLFCQKVHHSF